MIAYVGVVVAVVCLWFPVAFVLGVARAGRKGGLVDRQGVVDGVATALAGVLVAWLLLPWGTVPALLWAVPVAVTAYGLILAEPLWPRLPWVTGQRRWLRLAGTALGVAVVGAVGVLLVA